MKPTSHWIRWLLIIFVLLFWMARASTGVLVVYPDAKEPYQQAFEQIMTGLAVMVKEPVQRQKTSATTTPAELRKWLEIADPSSTVVLLGKLSLDLYLQSSSTRSVVVSAVAVIPQHPRISGLSLITDPALYLEVLREIQPNLQRVIVYYNDTDRQGIERLERAAKGLEVESIPITNRADLTYKVGQTLERKDWKTTVLWFQHSTLSLNPDLLFEYVVKESWERDIMVVSETLAQVRGGFLLAFYTDFEQYGQELGEFIQRQAKSDKAIIEFSHRSALALNIRMAQHLGLTLPLSLIQQAKRIFPEP